MLRLLLQLLLRPPARLTMGCGPSNIINPRKWRSRARSNNSGESCKARRCTLLQDLADPLRTGPFCRDWFAG